MPKPIDPITSAVIEAGLSAAAEEMFAVIKKTAMSPIIYEVLDVGTGITSGDGDLVTSGSGVPTFVGVLDKAVRRIIELEGRDNIRPGDMFVTNDPFFGGVTHLNDVVIALPVFDEDVLVAWTASIAHWNDVGGQTPGSLSTAASEIFQEGLRLPAVRLFSQGVAIKAVFDIIAANSRLPDFLKGDLWAQIAASRRAEGRIKKLVSAYGRETYEVTLAALFKQGERRALAALAALPHETLTIEEEQDDGAIWRASVTIAADRFVVDLRGNPPQRSAPYNVSRDASVIAAQMLMKALTDPTLFANSGSFKPLEVITEPGSIFHATGSAPHGYYFETRMRLIDMLWQCVARGMPERLPAGHFGSIAVAIVSGEHADTGRRYTMVEPQMGGWGATSVRDGMDAMYSTNHGETFNCPVEICEARYGLDVHHKRLNETGEGQGRYRGGRGLTIAYGMRSHAVLSAGFSRNRHPVWGLAGGMPGGTNGISVQRADGSRTDYAFASGIPLAPGDVISIGTANGGGWGTPA